MKKNTLTKIVCAAAVMLIAVILMVINLTVLAPERHKGQKTVSLSIEYADKTYAYTDLKTDAETVLTFLHEYDKALELQLQTKPSEYGDMLIGFKGVKQDEAAGAFYTYTINDEYAAYGISTQPIADGDAIVFSYGITSYDEDWTPTGLELVSSAGYEDRPVSAVYVTVWVVCGVALAFGAAFLLYALIADRVRGKAE